MTAARCYWPMHDIDLPMGRAKIEALLDMPRICEENRWTLNGEPRAWMTSEGEDANGAPRLYLTCDVDVTTHPRIADPRDSYASLSEAPLPFADEIDYVA
jgi:hypothetical protein